MIVDFRHDVAANAQEAPLVETDQLNSGMIGRRAERGADHRTVTVGPWLGGNPLNQCPHWTCRWVYLLSVPLLAPLSLPPLDAVDAVSELLLELSEVLEPELASVLVLLSAGRYLVDGEAEDHGFR